MTEIIFDQQVVQIPLWVQDLESFRRWTDLDEFPEEGQICFLRDRVWVDMSKEQLFSHGKVKGEYYRVLGNVVKEAQQGHFFPDGCRLTNPRVGISVKPDGTYLSLKSLRAKKAVLVEGVDGGFVELEGTADMALEILSNSSEHKDTVFLREAYWEAGIAEYWLVDARAEEPTFAILQHTAEGYVATRKRNGWMKSRVFGKSFRLVKGKDKSGYPEYTLEVH
jgi:Uma2 family endonuclease